MFRQLSKSFLVNQKRVIAEEEKKILQQIDHIKQEDPFLDPDHASDNAAVDTDVREQVGHDTVEAQVKDLSKRLQEIKIAMVNMEKGTYGTCERCGDTISQTRLELVPEARFCIECERKLRK